MSKIVRLPTARNPDSILEQAIGVYQHVILVGVNQNGELDFREGGENMEGDLMVPFGLLSRVCHKIMNGDYDAQF